VIIEKGCHYDTESFLVVEEFTEEAQISLWQIVARAHVIGVEELFPHDLKLQSTQTIYYSSKPL